MSDLIERLKYRIENPSAWNTFDQGASDLIREAVQAFKMVSEDTETLLQAVAATGEWEDEHEEILERWRCLRGDVGKTGWRWWWKEVGDDLYATDHPTREEALAKALAEEPSAKSFELIEARCWNDDINVEESLFAESRNHEIVNVAAND